MKARYNIAPSSTIPTIIDSSHFVEFFKWGLLSPWSSSLTNPPTYMNARVESLLDKPTFKKAFLHRRCLIPMNGYFEWTDTTKPKQPYYIFLKEHPLAAFAGIWEKTIDKNGNEMMTCAIITDVADEKLKHLHERAPLIIEPKHYSAWLNPKTKSEELLKILKESLKSFSYYAVSTRMSHPVNDGIECIKPLLNNEGALLAEDCLA